MGSIGDPQTWEPYDNIKDCSQGFCSIYCPQWCYIIFPPPPPFGLTENDSKPNLPPFVIAIIGILATAFLLVCYYTIISMYRGNYGLFRRRTSRNPSEGFNENQNLSQQEPWHVSMNGLDEALIKSITVCKYKKGDGLVEATDCSVCLGEFREDECLRLLPKCSHAFHIPCIDTWLKSHSNCPLCRANIVSTSPLQPQLLPPVQENPSESGPSLESQIENQRVIVVEASETNGEDVTPSSDIAPKAPLGTLQDLERSDTIIEIGDVRIQQIRRSVSLDSICQGCTSISDILCLSEDDDYQIEDRRFKMGVGSSSKQHVGEHSKYNCRSRVLHCGMSPIPMKRSFSGGRSLFTRHGREDYKSYVNSNI